MNTRTKLIVFVLAISLILSACAPQASPTESSVVSDALTKVAEINSTSSAATKAAVDSAYATKVVGEALGTVFPTPTQTGLPTNVYDSFTATPLPTATGTPNSYPWECYMAGARMTDGHVPGAERIGGAGRCDINALINSVSMQAFWEEIVNNDTKLPVGLERTDVAEGTFEANNDYLYVIGISHGSTMSFFVPDATESASTFPFWWTSCVQYNVETGIMTYYKDDSSNQPGGFNGLCTGTKKEFDGKTADKFSGEVMTYIQAIQTLAAKGYKTPNQPYVLDIVWIESWPE